MRTAVVCALALFTISLAGCLGGDGPDLQVASESFLEGAQEALGEDAVLFSIMGLEPNEPLTDEDTEGCGAFPRDTNPGDGRAPAWFYFYGSPSSGAALIIVTNDKGKVRCEMDASLLQLGAAPLPLSDWNLTAPEAARIIAENVDEYSSIVAGSPVMMSLVETPDGPVWSFVAVNVETFTFASWAVHARTGEYLGADLDLGLPAQDMVVAPFPQGGVATGSATGTFVVVLPERAGFTISDAGHGILEITVVSDDLLAGLGMAYEVQVHHPADGLTTHSATNGAAITIPTPKPGAYEVVAFPVVAGVEYGFSATFCAYTNAHCDTGGPAASEGARASWAPAWVG